MRKLCLTLLALLATAVTLPAQGVLVNETNIAIQLPRTTVIRPMPMPTVPPIDGGRRPVPQPAQTYAIKELNVDASVDGQIAQVTVSQTFLNTGTRQMEVAFVFPLPPDAAIEAMTFLVDGQEWEGKLLDAGEARRIYEGYVRRNEDPALLEWIGHGMFRTSVFPVPAGETRTVQISYTQLLRVDGGLTDFLFPMSTAKYTSKPIEKVEINLSINAPEEIKNVYSPTHEVKIQRPTPRRASVSFEARNTVPSNDFRLLFDTGTGEVTTRILSFRPEGSGENKGDDTDGFFMLLASPKIEQNEADILPKTVVFVLDHSGSMMGEKMVQAREALKFVLNNLREGDTFNIVPFSGNVATFKPEIQPYNAETRAEALAYTEAIRASGGTNIEEALKTSLRMIQDRKTPSYVLFLTDGLPTVNERNEMRLTEIAKTANQYGARIFAFGVGYDVNSRLLERLARDSRGQTEYVRPDEDIEERVARLYNRISSPVLTDVKFTVNPKPLYSLLRDFTNRVYPSESFDLFAGEQLVIVGRYSQPDDVVVTVKGKIGETEKVYNFDASLVDRSSDQSLAFIARLWAMRRIGEILDQLDLRGQNDELVKELVDLSTRYGILTPYTSFLADENTVLTDSARNLQTGRGLASNLSVAEGQFGVQQRAANIGLQRAMQPAAAMPEMETADLAMRARMAPGQAAGPGGQSAWQPGMQAYGGGMMGGMGGGGGYGVSGGARGGAGGAIANTAAPARPVASVEENVQRIGDRAFFLKSEVWIDSTLTEEQQKAENVVVVKQFSEEYFKLIEQYGTKITPFLALGGTQLINVDGRAYRVEP